MEERDGDARMCGIDYSGQGVGSLTVGHYEKVESTLHTRWWCVMFTSTNKMALAIKIIQNIDPP